MNASERRAEIMRILIFKRHITMRSLAEEFGVTDRTIRSDINALTVEFPLETVRGNGGCVKLADWYHQSKHILSQEQIRVLNEVAQSASTYQAKVLKEILRVYA